MRTHVQAVRLKGIDHIVLPPVHHHILTGQIYTPDISGLKRCGVTDIIPAVGVGWRRAADILLPTVILTFDDEVGCGKAPVVEQVGNQDAQSYDYLPVIGMLPEISEAFLEVIHMKWGLIIFLINFI